MCLRSKSRRFAVGALLITLVFVGLGQWISGRFRLGIGVQNALCLPYRVFLIDTYYKHPARDEYLAFRGDERLAPYFQAGVTLIKAVRGLPGDRVQIGDRIAVNDRTLVTPLPGLGVTPLVFTLGRQPTDFQRDKPVPAASYFVMGTSADSYDSRYWGYVRQAQVLGRAYPLW